MIISEHTNGVSLEQSLRVEPDTIAKFKNQQLSHAHDGRSQQFQSPRNTSTEKWKQRERGKRRWGTEKKKEGNWWLLKQKEYYSNQETWGRLNKKKKRREGTKTDAPGTKISTGYGAQRKEKVVLATTAHTRYIWDVDEQGRKTS